MKKFDWNIEKIKKIVPECVNLSEVLDILNIPVKGNNTKTLRGILDKNNIDYSHFTGRARCYNTNYKTVEEYLNNTKRIKNSSLKEKLIKTGLKENKCEICGITEWQGKALTIQLHHINGNHLDNRIENLQMLCPNCHSQTESYGGLANKNPQKKYCPDCGKEISLNSTYCVVCSGKHKRRVEKPSKDLLIKELKETPNFRKLGERYNVTDNTVRKWCKSYGISHHTKDYK